MRAELRGREKELVIPALEKWSHDLDATDPDYEHHLVEALWVYQGQGVIKSELLLRVLGAKQAEARLAATQVLRSWQHQIEGINRTDPSPRQRRGRAGALACGVGDW